MAKYSSIATKLLIALAEIADSATDQLDAFLLSHGSASQLQRNLNLKTRQYYSAFQGLERNGYIKKINENQFLISPKARVKIQRFITSGWDKKKWDGFWILVIFDIPEPKRSERDMLRFAIKRMGFIRLQNSVFIAPFADLKELSLLRQELKIEKYVSILKTKICEIEDDSKLRKRFGL